MSIPLFTSYATPEYLPEAERLIETLEQYEIRHHVVPVPTLGSWRLNCGRKPQHLKVVIRDIAKGPAVWVDADARVRRMPIVFESLVENYDFAAWFIPNENMQPRHVPGGARTGNDGIASGTMWFNDTDGARLLLDTWIEMDHGQHTYEQTVLGEAWYEVQEKIRTFRLPQAYCKVFDSPWFRNENGPTVIEHMQASRRLRRKMR